MFFILSKLLYFLIVPINWIVMLSIAYLFVHSPRLKRRIVISIVSIALIFTNPFLYKTLVNQWQIAPRTFDTGIHHQTGILLTGMIEFDKNKKGFFGSSSDRFIQTARMYHTGIISKILITGGSSSVIRKDPAEAIFLKQVFIESGIMEEDIIVEPFSRNTYENAVFSKRLIDSLHLQPPFALITSAFHMRRSEAVFKKAGIPFVSFPCDYKGIPKKISFDIILPQAHLLTSWADLIKEVTGLFVYKLTGKA